MLKARGEVLQAVKKGKLSGSWLVSGPYGVGKKTFSQSLTAFLMTGDWDKTIEFHPDVKWIEVGYTEDAKKEIQKTILAGKSVDTTLLNKKKEITIDDIRDGIKFLSLKSGKNFRILVVSLAEDMNLNAANALLKMLEEPYPNTLILLLTQNKGKLLPTISSRCRHIQIKPLPHKALTAKIRELLPHAKSPELLADLADGSIGLAMDIHQNEGIILYQKMLSFLDTPTTDLVALDQFCDYLAKDDTAFSMFQFFIHQFLGQKALKGALHKKDTENIIEIYNNINKIFDEVKSLYLDKKQTLKSIFLKINGALS
ncbi:MAG: hypothetical protein LBU87_04600 [Lactobacillales bacterium]|jgi:DNA polymerase-3 subunit delta'|nr:hypothetical protein [Lactobacillales bacterium]